MLFLHANGVGTSRAVRIYKGTVKLARQLAPAAHRRVGG
jgi:hypothetical protein